MKSVLFPVLFKPNAQVPFPMSISITDEEYQAIAETIGSDESVVGIDAKKTHILILHLLKELQGKMDSIESRLQKLEEKIS